MFRKAEIVKCRIPVHLFKYMKTGEGNVTEEEKGYVSDFFGEYENSEFAVSSDERSYYSRVNDVLPFCACDVYDCELVIIEGGNNE